MNWIVIILCFAISNNYASVTLEIEKNSNLIIGQLYHKLEKMPTKTMEQRISWFSKQFLNRPYVLGSLGEGTAGRYDQFPLYRIDAFDCDTFVNTVVALALASSTDHFHKCINFMRYEHAKIEYVSRLHFIGLDWNNYHNKMHTLKDITSLIYDKNKQSVSLDAKALVSKVNWYQSKTRSSIRLENNDLLQFQRLKELQRIGSLFKDQIELVSFVSFDSLFNDSGFPNMRLFNQIPHAAVIEIVRPNWDLTKQIGTHLNISHLGFAIWKKGILYFRNASSQQHKVIDIPLINYLKKSRQSPTIKGINIQQVLPQYSRSENCSPLSL